MSKPKHVDLFDLQFELTSTEVHARAAKLLELLPLALVRDRVELIDFAFALAVDEDPR
jgi:hypothetical protein